ncbi:MAG: DUF3795 domain-containing protein [Chloroflexota bacterium]
MKYVMDGYCGVYCGACPIMLATRAGNLDEDQQCFGCKSEKPTRFCATCGIKACSQRKGYDFCYQCNELESCELMKQFVADVQYPYGQCVMKNMEIIQAIGLPQWLEMQDSRWRCQSCGLPHSWYHETCPQCGQSVADYKADLPHI